MFTKNLNIKISEDKLAAFISLDCKRSVYPNINELIKELKKNKIIFGINTDMLEEICRNKKSVSNVKVASGITPVIGHSAQLVWHLNNKDFDDKVVFDETGMADYKHARNFCEVNEGDEIVSKLPKVIGKSGKTVTGEMIPTNEKDISLPIGENVEVSDDGLTLYATTSGVLNFYNGKVDISNVYHVNGDVSFNTGNVKYDGKVIITGDVRSGFRVEATDTIIIEGDVEAANIHSRNGDVIIKMGVLGKGRARILAGQKIHCGFIQDSEVKAGNDITVDHYIINCDVYSAGIVTVKENEGMIRGGKVFGERGIKVLEAGSPRNISTILGIGLNRNEEEEEDLNKLIRNEDEFFNRYELISKKERFLKLLFERIGKLSEEKQKELISISNEMKYINTKIDEIDQKKKELSKQSSDKKNKHKIEIFEKLHKGVLLCAGSDEFYIDKLYEKVVVYQDLDNIVLDDLIIKEG